MFEKERAVQEIKCWQQSFCSFQPRTVLGKHLLNRNNVTCSIAESGKHVPKPAVYELHLWRQSNCIICSRLNTRALRDLFARVTKIGKKERKKKRRRKKQFWYIDKKLKDSFMFFLRLVFPLESFALYILGREGSCSWYSSCLKIAKHSVKEAKRPPLYWRNLF